MSSQLKTRLATAVGVIALLATASGCGDESLPPGIVAKVRDHGITKTALNRAVIGRKALTLPNTTPPPYWPGDIRGCVTTKRRERSRAGDVGPKQIRALCRQESSRARRAALRLLIHGEWFKLEAERRGLTIPTLLRVTSNGSAGGGAGHRTMLGILTVRASQNIVGPRPSTAKDFSASEIKDHYSAHRNRYREDDTWLVQGVVSPTRSVARAAAARLRAGRSAAQTAHRLQSRGVRQAFPGTGSIWAHAVSPRIVKAAAQLDVGGVGTMKDPRGWLTLEVQALKPAHHEPLTVVATGVAQELSARRDRTRRAKFIAKLRARYQSSTVCASEYEVAECGT